MTARRRSPLCRGGTLLIFLLTALFAVEASAVTIFSSDFKPWEDEWFHGPGIDAIQLAGSSTFERTGIGATIGTTEFFDISILGADLGYEFEVAAVSPSETISMFLIVNYFTGGVFTSPFSNVVGLITTPGIKTGNFGSAVAPAGADSFRVYLAVQSGTIEMKNFLLDGNIPVPEPGTSLLLAIGILGLTYVGNRKQAA